MNHLWGRPMNIDTETFRDKNGNKAMYAWPSNLSPAGDKFSQLTAVRTAEIKKAHPEMLGESVPAELVTVSGSGARPSHFACRRRVSGGKDSGSQRAR